MSEFISSTLKNTETVVNKLDSNLNIVVSHFISVIQSQVVDLFKFLIDKNVIQISIGLLLATQIKKINDILQTVIISPIVNRVTFGNLEKLEDWKIDLLGIEIKIGLLMSGLIDFMLVILIVYYIWKLTLITDHKIIFDFFESFKPKI